LLVRNGRREKIIEVAISHFDKFGFKKTVIDDIVREVGIAKGTFYLEFPSKEDLFIEVIGVLRSKIMEEFYVAMKEYDSPLEKIRVMLRFTFDAMEDNPLLANLLRDGSELQILLSMLDMPGWQNEIESMLGFMTDILHEGIRKGEMRSDLDIDAFPFVFGSLKFIHYYKDIVTRDFLKSERLIDCLIDTVINGISAKKEFEGVKND